MTVATSDGESVWAFRYSSEGQSRSLYFSTTVRHCASCIPRWRSCTRWATRPASSSLSRCGDLPRRVERGAGVLGGVVRPGTDEMRSFQPIAP